MKLRVNGQPATLDIPDDVPLLWAIREELGLTGTKFGCGAAQCGYCQVGQIMAAVALLAARPDPTDDDIDAVMTANLCRCGTYPRIRRAIARAAAALRAGGQP